MLPPAGPPRLLDLGVARLPQVEEFPDREIPGTPSFMAPELYEGNRGDAATDQFALGALFSRLFTGHYPYGEVEPFSRPKLDRPANPEKLRPDLPTWLAMALARMVAPRPQDRFGDLVEVLVELEGGTTRGVPQPDRRSLLARHPLAFWQGVSALLAVALVLALALR
jgi:serine/threonine protein kinase